MKNRIKMAGKYFKPKNRQTKAGVSPLMAALNRSLSAKAEPAPLEWMALWDAMSATPDAWIPTTEDMYWEMLECVPPRAFVPGCFLVGEAERHNDEGKAVHACFKETGSKFFAKYMTVEQFQSGAL